MTHTLKLRILYFSVLHFGMGLPKLSEYKDLHSSVSLYPSELHVGGLSSLSCSILGCTGKENYVVC